MNSNSDRVVDIDDEQFVATSVALVGIPMIVSSSVLAVESSSTVFVVAFVESLVFVASSAFAFVGNFALAVSWNVKKSLELQKTLFFCFLFLNLQSINNSI